MIRVLVVDDETPARERLIRMLAAHPGIEVIGEASDGLSALEEIRRLQPQAVFLDIQMPELTGLEVARALGSDSPAIVFVTAHDEFAIQAFEAEAIDYLLKPVSEDRLRITLERLPRAIRSAETPGGVATVPPELLSSKRTGKFAVRCGARFVMVEEARITALLAQHHGTLVLTEGRELLVEGALESYVDRLDPERFVRVHRNAIVNADSVLELCRQGDRKYEAVLDDAKRTRVPISRERLDGIKARFGLKK